MWINAFKRLNKWMSNVDDINEPEEVAEPKPKKKRNRLPVKHRIEPIAKEMHEALYEEVERKIFFSYMPSLAPEPISAAPPMPKKPFNPAVPAIPVITVPLLDRDDKPTKFSLSFYGIKSKEFWTTPFGEECIITAFRRHKLQGYKIDHEKLTFLTNGQ